jgi:hypothetical protein
LDELDVNCTTKGIYVAEMRFLRAVVGHRFLGKKSNEGIEGIKQELQMTSLLSIIKKKYIWRIARNSSEN